MDSRRGPLKNAKHFTGELLGQRAYFNVSEQQSVLIINRVEKDDEGDYRCRVDFRYRRTLNDFMTLDVIVASKDVTILGNTNTPVYGKIGPYNEGSRLFLTCISGTAFFSEVEKKFGNMPFTLRALEDEKKARMGVVECVNHKLIEPFTVLYEKEGELVAQFKFTVLLMPSGSHKITGEAVDWDMYETEHDIKDDTIKQ
ncbi:uncharacterized protein LOC143242421 [Tachypleus tridentatus]|uniref:uncharacterized protein LOC143242421 n=1 Tax=Tachypleus tridentatus TaxID=6853 RepID=UPI003FD08A5C